MKNITRLLILAILFPLGGFAQNEANPWQVTVGVNAVDVYPVGEAAPQGDRFDQFFNVSEHWSILPSLSSLSINKYIGNNLSIGLTASVNRIEKWGDVRVENLMYYGIDASLRYSFSNLIKSKRIQPFFGIGGGYTWIDEGVYNNNNAGESDALIGAFTANGTLGLGYWFSPDFSRLLHQMAVYYIKWPFIT